VHEDEEATGNGVDRVVVRQEIVLSLIGRVYDIISRAWGVGVYKCVDFVIKGRVRHCLIIIN